MHALALIPLLLLPFTTAAPLFGIDDGAESSTQPTAESAAALAAITPIANFAEQAYCPLAAVVSQTCGGNCDVNPGVTVLASGGDGGLIPQFFVAHDPNSQSIVVSHQGTDPEDLFSILNDAEFVLTPINQTAFPQASSSVQVHDGFQQTFERTSTTILSAVQAGLAQFNVNKVQLTGHSLGAALAVLDSVFLSQNLPGSPTIQTTVFGLPRAGNPDWASLVDATLQNPPLIHMHNKNDPVPQVPPHDFGFQHPAGEVFIQTSGNVVACPGEENINCSFGDSLLDVDVDDHFGPYAGVLMGSSSCLGGGGTAASTASIAT